MQAVIKKTGMALGAWSKILSLQPLMVTAILHDTLKFELGQIVALKELFKQRDVNVVRVAMPWRAGLRVRHDVVARCSNGRPVQPVCNGHVVASPFAGGVSEVSSQPCPCQFPWPCSLWLTPPCDRDVQGASNASKAPGGAGCAADPRACREDREAAESGGAGAMGPAPS